MSNKQLTAVEWLVEELTNNGINHLDLAHEIIEQAKQMEKEQMIDAHGYEQSKLQDDGTWRVQTGEDYYNETYGGN